MEKRKVTDKDRERVKKVNDTLLEKGYSWEEIETFWNKCITETKELRK
ncbi:hypothetical protein FIA58_013930 [Flavobacterium jejuense]|uniref:Uncharacterized protein n=1 Tax=Flavobacterium jejuense TaxID=1544455 RepID=A0ABX0ISF2_9FLAO|nr:hypothetical protein [Flavobacterium jejuense]NHN26780.1 hypothetical protein [Flavobacterium jejuense]